MENLICFFPFTTDINQQLPIVLTAWTSGVCRARNNRPRSSQAAASRNRRPYLREWGRYGKSVKLRSKRADRFPGVSNSGSWGILVLP